ncbi:MAG: DUF2975 domain-containing protein [Verrucomicrobiota bacterium]|jgi:hypothetical protein
MNVNEHIPLVVFLCVFFGLMILRRIRSEPSTSTKDALANSKVKSPNLRLKQIQEYGYQLSVASLAATVFGTVGTLLLIFTLICNGTIFNLSQHRLLGDFGVIVLVLTFTLVAWFCHKLFQQYARGNLFTAEVVHHICQIGRFYIFAIVEKYFIDRLWETQHLQPLTGIPMFPLFAGALIFFIAWIMDEGRKIQEEQELTV